MGSVNLGRTVALLTAEDERRLGRIVRRGLDAAVELEQQVLPREVRRRLRCDVDAGRVAEYDFVHANLRLVVSVATRAARPAGTDLADMVGSGSLGLLTAVRKFDPEKGFKFSTYATWWIRQAIQRWLVNESQIRLPDALNREWFTIRYADFDTRMVAQRSLSDVELAEHTGIHVNHIRHLRSLNLATVPLDRPVGSDGTSTLADMLVDPICDVEDFSEAEAHRQLVAEALELLDDRSARIVAMRFGLRGYPPMTMPAIGDEFGLSRERVRQIIDKALRTIRIWIYESDPVGESAAAGVP
jgi:RNA polymerase primary sigma factor